MTIKTSLSIIFACFVFSLLVLLIFLVFINPQEAGTFGLIVFFISFFSTVLSFFSLFFIILKLRSDSQQDKILEGFVPAFRRAILISLFFVLIILFKFLKIINWWNGTLPLLLFIFLEIIISRRRKKIIYK